jgi:guanylate kinase
LYVKEPWRAIRAVYISGHPSLSRAVELSHALCACLPTLFSMLPESTTRKANKGEIEGEDAYFGCKIADLEKSRAEGKVLTWRQDGGDVYCRTLAEASKMYEKTGRVAVVVVGDAEGLAIVEAGLPGHAYLVHVWSSAYTCVQYIKKF